MKPISFLISIVSILLIGLSGPSFSSVEIRLQAPKVFSENQRYAWKQLENALIYGKYDVYVIDFNGIGGKVYLGIEFVNAVKEAQRQGKKIIFRVSEHSLSMHALSVCFADQVIYMKPNAVLMFHSIGYSIFGKDYRGSNLPNKDLFDQCIKKGILTKALYDSIESGHEVYIFPAINQVIIYNDPRPLK